MSDHHHHHSSNFLGGLKTAVKNSPRLMRKKLGGLSKKVGRSKQYSELDDCEDNGWLHVDEKLMVGVQYNIKYLGSMEVDFCPGDASENRRLGVLTMREINKLRPHHDDLVLTISVGRMTLTKPSSHEIVMRHSTSRIAYSTVDRENPHLFCYVALPRKSKIALCHVFWTKSAKMSYELTFTCAQAFDLNYRNWNANRPSAVLKANASEHGDIEPADAVASPQVRRKVMGSSAAEHAPSPLMPRKASSSKPVDIAELDKEDEDELREADEKMFGHIKPASSDPCLLEIGVDPEDFNKAKHTDA